MFNRTEQIVISPFSKQFPMEIKTGVNAKNYPYWSEVINTLNKDFIIEQIGIEGEEEIKGIDKFSIGLSLNDLKKKAKEITTWIAVDNFFPHLCNVVNIKGIVIFTLSDPLIFGYRQNINILKDRKYLRESQFQHWFKEPYCIDAAVESQVVIDAVYALVKELKL